MPTYSIKYDRDMGDGLPKAYEAARAVSEGDVIELENGMWHGVRQIRKTQKGNQLVLSESGQSAQQAELLLRQQLSE
ncbi:hypothetical protein QN404_11660 [Pseudomonas sp. RTS1]|jgi:hypothetical protein|uniref:hypothetical protein n=1 Tax=Pseudomonas TaxID=286 RepID=UPI00048B1622|nr:MULTISPECIES: hypothetical protein [Pseudomonas]MBI6975710.1 hypothetical protein [Pseudomonas lactis]MBJ2216398.1 hypothetical protein [Pseudomonas sp. MF7453]MEA9989544.1 hypothetical protein [Pseudomonas sp. RTS1]MEB0034477.1 hypothetical protein [Pseudomonas sp. RTS2]MEB0234171.1 hypothetical protein [Pseudomonas sp. 5S3]